MDGQELQRHGNRTAGPAALQAGCARPNSLQQQRMHEEKTHRKISDEAGKGKGI